MSEQKFNIPKDMDIPVTRRDKNMVNARWLLRNIMFRNSEHEKINDTITMIKQWIRLNMKTK